MFNEQIPPEISSSFDFILPFKLKNNCVAIGAPKREARKASHCGSKQQQRSHNMITLCFC